MRKKYITATKLQKPASGFWRYAFLVAIFLQATSLSFAATEWRVSGLNMTSTSNSGVGISGSSYNGNSSKGLIFTAGQSGQVIDAIGIRLIGVSPFNQSSTLKLTIASVNQTTNALTGILATDTVTFTSPTGSDFATSKEYTFGPASLHHIALLNLTSGTKYAMTVWGATGNVVTLAIATPYQASVYTASQTAGFSFVGLETAGNAFTSYNYFLAVGKSSNAAATASVVTHVPCHGGSEGSVTVTVSGGATPYSYAWSTSPVRTTATISGLTAGAYTVTVTDATSLSLISSTTVTEPATLSANASVLTNVNCNGNSNGSVTVSVSGGTTAYSYSWSTSPLQTAATATGLAYGTYWVTVTDAHSCTATSSTSVTQPLTLSANASVVSNVNCYGNSTGSATVSASGGTAAYSYSWATSPVQTGATATGLSTGTYWVTVTDANSCKATASATVTQPSAALLANASVVNHVGCYGNSTGSVTATASGGTAAYSYTWSTSPMQTGPTASGLAYGTYWVTVTDAHSCTATASATVTQPATALSASAEVVNNPICYGAATGSATASGSGGTEPYSYTWLTSPVQTNATATGISAGIYWVTVTDAHSCIATSSVTLTQPAQWWPEVPTGETTPCQNSANLYTAVAGKTNYVWVISAGGSITAGGTSTDNTVTVLWNSAGAQSVGVKYTENTSPFCTAIAPGVVNVTVKDGSATVISGAGLVTQGQVVTYSTPYVAGNTYTWNASHGNPELCFPYRNCLTLTWDFPCGIINPGYVRVTETNTSTGCYTTVTKWITINP